ncbi:MAG: CYTH and CHAD domain-containing protein [Candidatus Marithrix sp.]
MIETELKLLLNPKDIDKVKQHPLLQQQTDSQQLYSIYFDTVEHDLLRNKIGFRIRHIGDKKVQTLKTAGSGIGGLHTRQEWETFITSDTPDYEKIPAAALSYLPTNFASIKPIFITDFKRITWLLTIEDSTIEVALDQGKVKTTTDSRPISEIELELKSGSEITLYKVALLLLDDIPLTIENKSKAAIGYALCKPKPLEFYIADSVKLNHDMTSEQAFIHIIWHCLQHLQANEDIVLYGDDIEGIHQMWLALQRLLSCLNLYEPLIPKKTYINLYQEIKWINSILTIAKDWDIFTVNLQSVQPYYQDKLTELQSEVRTKQNDAYIQVREMLRSQRYTRILLLLGEWLLEKPWRNKLELLPDLDSPITDFANQVIHQHTDITQLDELNTKFINHVIHFFTEFYPTNIISEYNKIIPNLQDEIDLNIISNLLEQLDLNTQVKYFLLGWYAYQQKTSMDKFKIIANSI